MENRQGAFSNCEFVPSPEQTSAYTAMEYQLPSLQENSWENTLSPVFCVAWALVISQITNSKDVTFSMSCSAIPGDTSTKTVEDLIVGKVNLRLGFGTDLKVSDCLKAVQEQATNRAPSVRTSLETADTMKPEAAEVSLFQTLLMIHTQASCDAQNGMKKGLTLHKTQWRKKYAMTLEVQLGKDQTSLTALYDPNMVNSWTVTKSVERFQFIIPQIRDAGINDTISDIRLVTPEDLQTIWKWNEVVPIPIDRCVHDMVYECTKSRPTAPAICAWDGELTYGELDRISSGLAGHLIELGTQPGIIVPLIFEKSIWTVVAMLGVIKSGAAFVLLDSSLPEQRLHSICRQTKADIAVSSCSNEKLSLRLSLRVVALGPHLSKALYDQSCPEPRHTGSLSIMYVAFTSGSTGSPKGAIISHQNLASALYHQKTSLKLTTESRVFDFSSYSFDVSICNIFATLTAGGCVCIPKEHDRKNRLAESIASLNANTIDLTPSVARLLSPEQAPGLKTIIFGGEALRVKDVAPWWGKIQIISLYGPCECTPNSTINSSLTSPEEATYMGRGVGLITWIADSENHGSLVALGCVGELLLEGPLVGCGYLDNPEKTAAAFIEDPLWLLQGVSGRSGRHGRLYKTGDLVRYNEDGNLVFVGRKDTQVKIRGQRIELGEIEHALRSRDYVDDAVAVTQHDNRQETWLASFVTLGNENAIFEECRINDDEVQQVELWEKQFEADYTSIGQTPPEKIGRDFAGWTSMYDGSKIEDNPMNEWLNDTIKSILNGRQPGHVLEIGTGSGMILFNLIHGLQSYIGFEPSGRAVQFIMKAIQSIPGLADKVQMFKATASDLHHLSGAMSPSLVVINSVAQYFPSQVYLFNVVEKLVQMKSIKTLFFGDIRSHALYQEFLAVKALYMSGGQSGKHDIRRIMADLERDEPELLVDPAFFTALSIRLADYVEHVEILPKRMYSTNELSSYRYAAVIHVKSQDQPQQRIREVSPNAWINFKDQGLSRRSLTGLLEQSSSASTIAISNIPHSKSIFERFVVQALEDQNDAYDHAGWLLSARTKTQDYPSLSATDLVEIAAKVNYHVEISWARQFSQSGGLDAIFHRNQPANGESRVMFRFPGDHQGRPYESLTNEPLRQQLRQRVQKQLHEMLCAKLPAYMIPRTVTILEKMPLTANGKIDRRALSEHTQSRKASHGPAHQSLSATEHQMRKIWAEVLSIEPATIGRNESFVELGGNSIDIMKVMRKAREAGLEIKVADLF